MKSVTFNIIFSLGLIGFMACAPYSLPEVKTYPTRDASLTFYLQSQDLYQSAEYHKALAKIDSAILISQNFAQYYELKGDILRNLKEIDPALQAYQTAIRKRSNNTQSYINIADLYHQQNHFRESIRYYRKAISVDSTLIPLNLEIARNYIAMKEWELAQNGLDDYRKQVQVQSIPVRPEYYYMKGQCFYYQKNYRSAIHELLQYRPGKNLDREVMALLGKTYYALNNFEAGLGYFNKLIRLENMNGEWYYYRGIYFYQVNNLEDARNQFQVALGFDPTLYHCHYYLGKIYEQLDDDKKAVEEFRLYRESMRQMRDLGTEPDELRDLKGIEEELN
jgi:tetratricopeptide (TPR) repeat protein